jgi:hypothetical protein
VKPDHAWWPQGYDLATLTERFGRLPRHLPDGTTRTYGFDPKGVISNAWVARGVAEQRRADQLPRALGWWVLKAAEDQTHEIVAFDDRWVLFRPDPHVVWTWIE